MSIKWIEIHATFWLEILTRAFLSVVFLELEQTAPFVRKIHIDELWLYKNPRTPSYVPTNLLWPLVFAVPTFVMFVFFLAKRNKTDFCQSLLAFSLALGLNGVITNIIKLVVGRPRPDFFYRCFPEGHVDLDHISDIGSACTGEADAIQEGRKSFPSGHASFSFCSLGFLSLWICGKLCVFGRKRGQGWRLVMGITPMVMALMVALSRTSDYHHHWQDVLVGSVLGLFIAYLCYRQYYPRLTSPHCHLPYLMIPTVTRPVLLKGAHGESFSSQGPLFLDPESPMEEQVKWM
ncbi:phospholipid phosphatase 5-like [Penaeus monodon]|uniref:phospholipid phosphatase 5-like n=1 Tax=Penaeus monodon TaxID=6687 RepID=UPI0018A7095E|nr:phospholipid phosphatase 5-like [Penaeus monodon]